MGRIVAFLQNQWFREPERVRKYMEGPDREYYISAFLFMGCLSGRRLRRALGEDLCSAIIWEEISRQIGGHASSKFPADLVHIFEVIQRHSPTHVVAFGGLAGRALASVQYTEGRGCKWTLLAAPHPAARGQGITEAIAVHRRELTRATHGETCYDCAIDFDRLEYCVNCRAVENELWQKVCSEPQP